MTQRQPAWLRFWLGLTRASALAGSTAALSFAAVLVAVVFVFSPARLGTDFHKRFLASNRDHDLAVTSTLLHLRESGVDETRLFIVGSSATRNSLGLKRMVARLKDHEVPIDHGYDLTLAALRFPHVLRMLDQIPEGQGILVLGINRVRLFEDPHHPWIHDAERPRLGVSSQLWDVRGRSLGLDVPRRTDVFLLDNRRFYLRRFREGTVRWWNDEPPWDYRARPFLNLRGQRYSVFRTLQRELRAQQRLPAAERERRLAGNLERLREVTTVARRKGLFVVYYDPPVNPRFARRVRLSRWATPAFERVEALARELNVPIVHAPKLKAEAFYDHMHLRKLRAFRRTTDSVADQVAQAWAETK